MVYYLARERNYLHLDLHCFLIQADGIRQIIRIGGPAALQGIVFSLPNIVIQAAINMAQMLWLKWRPH